jgi:Phosphotransferase enzyme family
MEKVEKMNQNYNIEEVVQHFQFEGEFIKGYPYGGGHINDTYALEYKKSDGSMHRYILQRVNHHVFKNVDELMSNIIGVTQFLRDKILESGGDPERETLNLVKTVHDQFYYKSEAGLYFRAYIFIEEATTYDTVEKPEHFYNAGLAFGRFQKRLETYDAQSIYDVIPNFHNTKARFETFKNSVNEDIKNRKQFCQKEIDFLFEREAQMGILVDALESGAIPTKVTHNDTKLNNIMIDDKTGEGVCVIDLDTIMKGSLLYDFGDAIRFGTNTAMEDETNLELVQFDLNLFEAFVKGFLNGIDGQITEKEIELLPYAGMMMTMECGMRFLTDYLCGDTYFRIHRENHNLDRARNQLKLVSEMEKHFSDMQAIVKRNLG